jgi:hypothetical protein
MAILISTSKNAIFFIITYVYSSTKLEKRAEQVLPGSKGERGQGGIEGQGEKWPKQCMHI